MYIHVLVKVHVINWLGNGNVIIYFVCSNLHYTTETACVTQGTWDGSCDISSGGREIDEAKCIVAVGIWGL